MINVNAQEQTLPNTYPPKGSGIYNYTLPRVDKNGTRAIIGRMNMPKSSVESRYLSK
jgi:hypothetical protein